MHQKFHPNLRKNFFTVWVTVHQKILPREIMNLHCWKYLGAVWAQFYAMRKTLLEQGGWTRHLPDATSNFTHHEILSKYQNLYQQACPELLPLEQAQV